MPKQKELLDDPAIIAEPLGDAWNRKLGRSYLRRDELEAARLRIIASLRTNAINEKAFSRELAAERLEAITVFHKFDDQAKTNAKKSKEFQKLHDKKEISFEQNQQVLADLQRDIKRMNRHKSRLQTRLTGLDSHAKTKQTETRRSTKDTTKLSKTIKKQMAQVELDKASIDALINTWESVGEMGSRACARVSSRADDMIANWISYWPSLQMMLAGESSTVASLKTNATLHGLLAEWWALHGLAVDVDALTQMCSDEMLLTMKMDYTDATEMLVALLNARHEEAEQQAQHQAQVTAELERRRTMLKEMALSLVYALEQDSAKSSAKAEEVLARTLAYYMEQKERAHDAKKSGAAQVGPEDGREDLEPSLTVELARRIMDQMIESIDGVGGANKKKENERAKQEDGKLISAELEWIKTLLGTSDMAELNKIILGSATVPMGKMMSLPHMGLEGGSIVSIGSTSTKASEIEGATTVKKNTTKKSRSAIVTDYGPSERAACDSSLAIVALETRRLLVALENAVVGHVLTKVQGSPPDDVESLQQVTKTLSAWHEEHRVNAHGAVAMDTAFPSSPGWLAGKTAFAVMQLNRMEEHIRNAISMRKNSILRLAKQNLEYSTKQAELDTPGKFLTRGEKQELEELEQQREEILAQRDAIEEQNSSLKNLNENLEKSYQNLNTLTSIGQEITTVLELKEVIKQVYEQIQTIMPAEGFGIGLLREEKNELLR